MNEPFKNIGNERLPSVLQDPFKKNHVKRMVVSYSESSFTPGQWSAWGKIEFANGKTTGVQDFDGVSFDEVVQKIKAFITTEL